jgi:hypothetical protein
MTWRPSVHNCHTGFSLKTKKEIGSFNVYLSVPLPIDYRSMINRCTLTASTRATGQSLHLEDGDSKDFQNAGATARYHPLQSAQKLVVYVVPSSIKLINIITDQP